MKRKIIYEDVKPSMVIDDGYGYNLVIRVNKDSNQIHLLTGGHQGDSFVTGFNKAVEINVIEGDLKLEFLDILRIDLAKYKYRVESNIDLVNMMINVEKGD